MANTPPAETAGEIKGKMGLMCFAAAGETEKLRKIVAEASSDHPITSEDLSVALRCAAKNGRHHAVEALIECGANPLAADSGSKTALMFAAEGGHILTAETLIKHGADARARDHMGFTAQSLAVMNGHDLVVHLLKREIGRCVGFQQRKTRVLHNPEAESPSPSRSRLATPARPGESQPHQSPSCSRAASRVRSNVHSPRRSACSVPDFTPIDQWKILVLSFDSPDDVEPSTTQTLALLEKLDEISLRFGNDQACLTTIITTLLTQGKVRIDDPNHVERLELARARPLNMLQAKAYANGYTSTLPSEAPPPTVAELLSAEPKDSPTLSIKSAALIRAAMEGRTITVNALLDEGCDVNTQLADGWTVLMCALWNGHTETARALVGHGADIEAKFVHGWTPLMIASWAGHEDAVRMLIEHGANVNSIDATGKSVLMWAAQKGANLPIVQLLLERGADACAKNHRGETALSYALREHNATTVELLKLHIPAKS